MADLKRTIVQKTIDFTQRVRYRLIVSCQALPDEPLCGSRIMARMAQAACQGGAVAIRANGPEDIRSIREAIDLPIIGLYKDHIPGYSVYITPALKHAQAVAQAGADIVAIDGTNRSRPMSGNLADFIAAIHHHTGCPVLADISTVEEGLAAEAAGADLISTTMSGYTDYTLNSPIPDLELVRELTQHLGVPLLAEGRYRSPEQVIQALEYGATSVVVGSAITRPQEITRQFVDALRQ